MKTSSIYESRMTRRHFVASPVLATFFTIHTRHKQKRQHVAPEPLSGELLAVTCILHNKHEAQTKLGACCVSTTLWSGFARHSSAPIIISLASAMSTTRGPSAPAKEKVKKLRAQTVHELRKQPFQTLRNARNSGAFSSTMHVCKTSTESALQARVALCLPPTPGACRACKLPRT